MSIFVKCLLVVIGAIGFLLGVGEKKKRKQAEEKLEKLHQEFKEKTDAAIVTDLNDVQHVEEIGEIIEKPNEEIIETANDLFDGATTVGEEIKTLRQKNKITISSLSKLTGYKYEELLNVENNKSISIEKINKIAKALKLSKEEKNNLLKMHKDVSKEVAKR